jgi:ribosomal protein L28
LRVSTAGLRRIDTLGVEAVLAEIKARKAASQTKGR